MPNSNKRRLDYIDSMQQNIEPIIDESERQTRRQRLIEERQNALQMFAELEQNTRQAIQQLHILRKTLSELWALEKKSSNTENEQVRNLGKEALQIAEQLAPYTSYDILPLLRNDRADRHNVILPTNSSIEEQKNSVNDSVIIRQIDIIKLTN